MNNFGDRLREERERLGFNQEQLGAIGGVKKLSQFNYEKSERKPDIVYLSAIKKVGIDIHYVITGECAPIPDELSEMEQLLIDSFRAMNIEQRRKFVAMVCSGELDDKKKKAPKKKKKSASVGDGNTGTVLQATGNNNVQIGGNSH